VFADADDRRSGIPAASVRERPLPAIWGSIRTTRRTRCEARAVATPRSLFNVEHGYMSATGRRGNVTRCLWTSLPTARNAAAQPRPSVPSRRMAVHGYLAPAIAALPGATPEPVDYHPKIERSGHFCTRLEGDRGAAALGSSGRSVVRERQTNAGL